MPMCEEVNTVKAALARVSSWRGAASFKVRRVQEQTPSQASCDQNWRRQSVESGEQVGSLTVPPRGAKGSSVSPEWGPLTLSRT